MEITNIVEDNMENSIEKYLVFKLNKEEYAININVVQEIIKYEKITSVSVNKDFLVGMINLRDNIVPVIDLRIKFDLSVVSYNELTVNIILNINNKLIGIIVDSVSDVVSLEKVKIQKMIDISWNDTFNKKVLKNENTVFLNGLYILEERTLILLDIENLILSKDVGLIKQK